MNRPDFSNLVAHFSKDSRPVGEAYNQEDEAVRGVQGTAKERLISILTQRKIVATPMPWTNKRAVAFTECPFWSLVDHAERYSPFGLGFTKTHLFEKDGGPAIYLRPDLHKFQTEGFIHRDHENWVGFDSRLYSFVTMFMPEYAPSRLKDEFPSIPVIDYSHEREWRVPRDFTFNYADVQFVIVKSYEDMAQFPRELKDAIGRHKFIIMDIYRQIETLWPTHRVWTEN